MVLEGILGSKAAEGTTAPVAAAPTTTPPKSSEASSSWWWSSSIESGAEEQGKWIDVPVIGHGIWAAEQVASGVLFVANTVIDAFSALIGGALYMVGLGNEIDTAVANVKNPQVQDGDFRAAAQTILNAIEAETAPSSYLKTINQQLHKRSGAEGEAPELPENRADAIAALRKGVTATRDWSTWATGGK